MRWSIVRTIWLREMRDQLRDRRTLLMIVGLPLVLYPLMGIAVLQFAVGFAEQPSYVGIVVGNTKDEDFPPRTPESVGQSPAASVAWLTATPGLGSAHLLGAVTMAEASRLSLEYPHFIHDGQFTIFDSKQSRKQAREWASQSRILLKFIVGDSAPWLEDQKVDLVLTVGTISSPNSI